MHPTLEDGDLVWVQPMSELPSVDEIVVVRDPERPGHTLIKRVRSRGDASFSVGSDDPTVGRDSRHFGSLRQPHLLGRAVVFGNVQRRSSPEELQRLLRGVRERLLRRR